MAIFLQFLNAYLLNGQVFFSIFFLHYRSKKENANQMTSNYESRIEMSSRQHDYRSDRPLPAPTNQSSIALPAQSGIYEELDKDDALGSLTQHRGFHNIAMTIDGDGRKHEYDFELPNIKLDNKSSGHYENFNKNSVETDYQDTALPT